MARALSSTGAMFTSVALGHIDGTPRMNVTRPSIGATMSPVGRPRKSVVWPTIWPFFTRVSRATAGKNTPSLSAATRLPAPASQTGCRTGVTRRAKHLELAEHVERTLDERREIGRRRRRRSAPPRRRAPFCRATRPAPTASVRTRGIDVGHDDVVEAERQRELESRRILRRVAAAKPIAVRAKIFVEIAAVQIDDDVRRRRRSAAVTAASARCVCVPFASPGYSRVHALAIDRIQVRRHLKERGAVQQRRDDHRSGERSRIDARDELLHRDDRRVLGAVRARDEGDDAAGPRAANHRDGNRQRRIGAGRNGDRAVRGRAWRRHR